jgi:hypothetical protein
MTISKFSALFMAGVLLIAASSLHAVQASAFVLYLDMAVQELPAPEPRTIGQPRRVKLSFEVQENGHARAPGTDKLRAGVLQQVHDSGMFSSVEEGSAGNDNVLAISINRVRLAGKRGGLLTDNFICTLRYLPEDNGQPLVATAEQIIYTVPSDDTPPARAMKAESAEDAMKTMTRAVISHALNELARNPQFN